MKSYLYGCKADLPHGKTISNAAQIPQGYGGAKVETQSDWV
jgi:hypothetical protein